MADRTDQFYRADHIFGYGSQFLIHQGDGSPGTYQALAGVTKIKPGSILTAVFDKTHLRSPEAHREKGAGLRDSGPIVVEGIYMPGEESQANSGRGVAALARTREEVNCIIRLPTGSPELEIALVGVITEFTPGEIGPDDKIPFTMQVTPLRDYSAGLP